MNNSKTKPKIGIVSGFGPIAGIDVASKIHKYAAEHYGAVEDFEYPDFVLVSKGVEGFDKYGAINDKFEPAILDILHGQPFLAKYHQDLYIWLPFYQMP